MYIITIEIRVIDIKFKVTSIITKVNSVEVKITNGTIDCIKYNKVRDVIIKKVENLE